MKPGTCPAVSLAAMLAASVGAQSLVLRLPPGQRAADAATPGLRPALKVDPASTAIARAQGLDRYLIADVPPGADARVALAAWMSLGRFEAGTASKPGSLAAPNDPGFAYQWALRNLGGVYRGITGTPGADVEAEPAWQTFTGSPETILAVIDSGIARHPEFAGRTVPGWCVGPVCDPYVDCCQHGTHVAGIAAAAGNNGIGIAGVNWATRLMSCSIASPGFIAEEDVASAIVFAADHGAGVINMSLQFFDGVEQYPLMHAAVRYADALGAVLVAAAGNDARAVAVPGAFPEVIAVGATDPNDGCGVFSGRGPEIDISAPGVEIYSTIGTAGYDWFSGTSMASPVVAGVATLVRGIDPALTPAQVRHVIEVSAEDLGAPGWDPGFGWGRADAGRAVRFLTCPADCNFDGQLNAHDFGCFQTRAAAGDRLADVNLDGRVDIVDFVLFQNTFAAGCRP